MASVQDVIDLARTYLPDPSGTRWTDEQLMEYVSKAEANIVLVLPHAYPAMETISLVEGATQVTTGWKLLDVLRNGTGEAVTKIDKLSLDQFRPNWINDTKTDVVKHWMYDERNPGSFMIYPPSDGTGSVDVLKAGTPERHLSEAEDLFLGGSYLVPLAHLTASYAFLMTAYSDPQAATLADRHEAKAMQILGFEGSKTKGGLVSADTDEGR